MLTVGILLYGDYPQLARRCLGSILSVLPAGKSVVQEIKIGCNQLSTVVKEEVDRFADSVASRTGLRTTLYIPSRNVGKYPLMRRMLYDHDDPPGRWFMWFDDDSYLAGYNDAFWTTMLTAGEHADIVGQYRWFMPAQGRQLEWLQQQPWYDPAVGLPPKRGSRPCFKFCQGSFWMARSSVLQKYNWPWPELHHNGGDSLLGELCRQQKLRVVNEVSCVRLNADVFGAHSSAKRRGLSVSALGAKWEPGLTPDLTHQDFELTKCCVGG